MKAMVLKKLCNLYENQTPLELLELSVPVPAANEILVKVSTCGVCHTELVEIEGRTPPPKLPVVLGHQLVGLVEAIGSKVTTFKTGDRVGVAWIFLPVENVSFVCQTMRTCVEISRRRGVMPMAYTRNI